MDGIAKKKGADKFVGSSAEVEDDVPRGIHTIVPFKLEREDEDDKEQMAMKKWKWSPG
jgi:hypothetical protein